jgi:hypothetical protein
MNDNQILKTIKKLKKVEPNKKWLTRNRDLLMAVVEEDVRRNAEQITNKVDVSAAETSNKKEKISLGAFFPSNNTLMLLRPAGAFLSISIVVLTSGIFTVSAAQDTLPGDTLYNVKLVSEKVQKALTPSEEEKAKLDITFAGKRIDELEQIIAEPESDEIKAEQVETVLQEFEENVNSANETLTEISQTEDHEEATLLAQDIDEKVSDYADALEVAVEKVEEGDTQDIVAAAATLADETAEASFNVIIEKHVSGDAPLPDHEIAGKIGEKISDVSALLETVDEQIDNLINTSTDALIEGIDTTIASSTATSSETLIQAKDQKDTAELALEEAKELIESDDLTEAISKINEGKDLIDAAQDSVDDFVEESEQEDTMLENSDEAQAEEDIATSTEPLDEETDNEEDEPLTKDDDEIVAVEASPQT